MACNFRNSVHGISLEENHLRARVSQKYRAKDWYSYLLTISSSQGVSRGTIVKSHLLHSSSRFICLHDHAVFPYDPMPDSKCRAECHFGDDLRPPGLLLMTLGLSAAIHSEAQQQQQQAWGKQPGNLGWVAPHYSCGRKLWDGQGTGNHFNRFCLLSSAMLSFCIIRKHCWALDIRIM